MAFAVAVAAVLMVVAGAVGLLGGARMARSTPEGVAESFVRTLVAGDYDDALSYVDASLKKNLDTSSLRHFAVFIVMRSGNVRDIRGERGWVRGRRAEAVAKLVTDAGGDWNLNIKLVRTHGLWAVAEIGSIQNASTSPNNFGERVPLPIAQLSISTVAFL
ncbi:MAG: hypothetical protein H7X80_01675 [bacterium]|nr:hypothetical protein [Candidatus Kapabacteria bacterium]